MDYKEVCNLAKGQNVLVNTIYCGDRNQGIRDLWKDGASCSSGDYFNINSDKRVVHIPTPYDNEIRSYNDSLNTTYVGYGSRGRKKMKMQISQIYHLK